MTNLGRLITILLVLGTFPGTARGDDNPQSPPPVFRYLVVLDTTAARFEERDLKYPYNPWAVSGLADGLEEIVPINSPCGMGHYTYALIEPKKLTREFEYDVEDISFVEVQSPSWRCGVGWDVFTYPTLVKFREWENALYIEETERVYFDHDGEPYILFDPYSILDPYPAPEPRVLDRRDLADNCELADMSDDYILELIAERDDIVRDGSFICFTKGVYLEDMDFP